MALIGKFEKDEKTSEKDKFVVTFTNGTIQQLKDLAIFLNSKDFVLPEKEEEKLIEVLRVGIGWLEKIKNDQEK